MAEKRMIDANVLMEHLTRCIEEEKVLVRAVCMAIKCFVEQMPTVEAVQVVRCRDCKSYNGHRYCNYLAEAVLDDDFCSYGERRTDG